jgi:hypothetical protein
MKTTQKLKKTKTKKAKQLSPLAEAVNIASNSIAAGGQGVDMTQAMSEALKSHKKKSLAERVETAKRVTQQKHYFSIPTNHSFWSIHVEYQYEYDCSAGFCDGICRCGRVEGTPEISDTLANRHAFARECISMMHDGKKISTLTLDDVISYKLFTAMFDNEAFSADVKQGYYGEEVDNAKICITKKISNGLDVLNSDTLTLTEKLISSLAIEYPFAPAPKIQNCQLALVNLNDVECSTPLIQQQITNSTSFNEYTKIASTYAFNKTVRKTEHMYNFAIIPVVKKSPGGKYTIVDGNHRLAALKALSANKVYTKVLKKIYVVEVT